MDRYSMISGIRRVKGGNPYPVQVENLAQSINLLIR